MIINLNTILNGLIYVIWALLIFCCMFAILANVCLGGFSTGTMPSKKKRLVVKDSSRPMPKLVIRDGFGISQDRDIVKTYKRNGKKVYRYDEKVSLNDIIEKEKLNDCEDAVKIARYINPFGDVVYLEPNSKLSNIKSFVETNPNGLTAQINTLFLIAVFYNEIEIAKFFLDNGADVNFYHSRALKIACINGNIESVKMLIEHGADTSKGQNIAFRKAVAHNHQEIINYFIFDLNIEIAQDTERLIKKETLALIKKRDLHNRLEIKLSSKEKKEIIKI